MGRNFKVGTAEHAEGSVTRRSVYSILNTPDLQARVDTFID